MGHKGPTAYEGNAKLCLAISDRPCLYDRSDAAYLKKDASEAAWEAIANECADTVISCKTRWRKIRESYVRSIAVDVKQRRPSNNRKYELTDVLEWFKPHIASLNDKSYESDREYADIVKNQVSDKPTLSRVKRCFSMMEGSMHALRKQMSQYEFADDEASKKSHESEGLDRRYNLRRACKRSLEKSPVNAPQNQLEVKRRLRSVHQKLEEPTTAKLSTINKSNGRQSNSTEKTRVKNHQENASEQSIQQELKLDSANANKGKPLRATESEIKKSKDQRRTTRDTTPESEYLNLRISEDSSRSSNSDQPPEHEINSHKKIKDIEEFFKSVTPYVADMNTRQLFNFKKQIYQALMDVFDDPSDFPLCDEVLVNPSPKSLIFDKVTPTEQQLMRQLVSVVISAKPNLNSASLAEQIPSTATSSPLTIATSVENPPSSTVSEKTIEVLSNPSEKQVRVPSQLVSGVAKANQPAVATRQQALVPDSKQTHISGKVVRLNNKGTDNCALDGERQHYRIVQNPTTTTSRIMTSTTGTKSSSPMTYHTISTPITVSSQRTASANPTASVNYRQLQANNTFITPISTNGSFNTNTSMTTNGMATTNGPVSTNALVATNGCLGSHASATNKPLTLLPANAISMRRYSIAGVPFSQAERRTPTKAMADCRVNMVNIITNSGSVVSTRVPVGVQITRAVRPVLPMRTQPKADNTNQATTNIAAVPTMGFNQFASSSKPPALSPLSSAQVLTSKVSQPPYTSTPLIVKTADELNATQCALRNTNQRVRTPVSSERPRRNSMGILTPDFETFVIKKEPVD